MTNSAWQATIQDELGNIIPSAEVIVVIESTGLPATIFSDRAGTPLTNPFFANADGFAQFFTIAGEYRITATNSGTGQANTWRYVRMGDAGSRDIGTGSSQVPTNDDLPAFGTAAEANTGTGAAQVPTNNDLGTAAQADVQTSPSDATAGRLMAVGAFGLGTDTAPQITTYAQLDSTIEGGVYSVGTIFDGTLTVKPRSPTRTTQYREVWGGGATVAPIESRVSSDGGVTWSDWQPVYTGANYQPFVFAGAGHVALMKNKTGANIAGGAVVDGSLLEYSLATSGGTVTTSATAGQSGQEWVNKGAVLGVDQFGIFVLRN